MEVTANKETDVVALSYLLGVIVKDIVNSNHMRAHYQVMSILLTAIELKRLDLVFRLL